MNMISFDFERNEGFDMPWCFLACFVKPGTCFASPFVKRFEVNVISSSSWDQIVLHALRSHFGSGLLQSKTVFFSHLGCLLLDNNLTRVGFHPFSTSSGYRKLNKNPRKSIPMGLEKTSRPGKCRFPAIQCFFFGGGSFPSTQLLSEQRSPKKEKFPRESRCDWLETRQSLWILLLNPPGSLWWIRLRWRLLRSQKMTSWVTRPKTETSEGSKCHDIFGIVNWILDVKGCVGHDETILWRVFRPINLHKVNSSCLVVWSGMVPVMP